MPLIQCPDCGKDVSDQASSCPHCGRPVEKTKIGNKPLSSTKKPAIVFFLIAVISFLGVFIYLRFPYETRSEKIARELGMTQEEAKAAYERLGQEARRASFIKYGIRCNKTRDFDSSNITKTCGQDGSYYCPLTDTCMESSEYERTCGGFYTQCIDDGKLYYMRPGENINDPYIPTLINIDN